MATKKQTSTDKQENQPVTPNKRIAISKKAFFSIMIFASFILVALTVIFLAQGYRIQNNQIYGTGILVVTSTPNGATVKLDGDVSGATNTTISTLRPGTYNLSISKEGYTEWHREVTISKEKVTTIKALLAPLNPSLSPITSTAVNSTVLSPDGQKLAYTAKTGSSAGIWVMDLSSQPFNLGRKPNQILEDTVDLPYSAGHIEWSPNSKDLLITLNPEDTSTAYLVSIDNPKQVRNIGSTIEEVKTQWQQDNQAIFEELRANFKPQTRQIIDDHQSSIQWSPDNLKFLYSTEEDGQYTYYVYDKEKKQQYKTYQHSKEGFVVLRWFADSEHLIMMEKDSLNATAGTISIIAKDGLNKQQLFSGTLIGDTLYTYLNGSKLIILTSFNLQEETYYLYAINL